MQKFLNESNNLRNPSNWIDNSIAIAEGVPSWVKNNASWWTDGKISDKEFVNGIQYLVKSGQYQYPYIENQNK